MCPLYKGRSSPGMTGVLYRARPCPPLLRVRVWTVRRIRVLHHPCCSSTRVIGTSLAGRCLYKVTMKHEYLTCHISEAPAQVPRLPLGRLRWPRVGAACRGTPSSSSVSRFTPSGYLSSPLSLSLSLFLDLSLSLSACSLALTLFPLFFHRTAI